MPNQVAQIARSRANNPLIPAFNTSDLEQQLALAGDGEHIILQPGDFTNVTVHMPENVYMTVLPGAFLDYGKVNGAERIADLNFLADLLDTDVAQLSTLLNAHITNTDNPHSVTAEQVGSEDPLWNANQILSIPIVDDDPQDQQVLVYNETTNDLSFTNLPQPTADATSILGIDVDGTGLEDGRVLTYHQATDTFVFTDVSGQADFDTNELVFTHSSQKLGQPGDPNLYLGNADGPNRVDIEDYIFNIRGFGGVYVESEDEIFGGLHLDVPHESASNVLSVYTDGDRKFQFEILNEDPLNTDDSVLTVGGLGLWPDNWDYNDGINDDLSPITVGADVLMGDTPAIDDNSHLPSSVIDQSQKYPALFHVFGNMKVEGQIRAEKFVELSSAAYKADIQSLEANILDRVCSLEPVSYVLKGHDKREYGFIAEQVEQVFPELVYEMGEKGINYGRITAVLVDAIKELRREVNILKSQSMAT